MSKNICYWYEQENGCWVAGCQKSVPKRHIQFEGGVGPVVFWKGKCPGCLKDLFEVPKRTDETDFINELNLMEFHR